MIRILVDSASDISYKNSDNIMVVPLSVNIDGKNYLDGIELGHDEFYEKLPNVEEFPKTSQPAPSAFVEKFEEVKKAGDEVICLLVSSGISGTYQSALLAKSIVDYDKIHIIDSLSAIYCIKILVEEVQKCIKENMKIEDIIERVENLKSRVQILLSVDTLEYLYKGGRLDKTSAVVGSIAKIKPIIELGVDGKINVVAKSVGMVRAMNTIVDLVAKKQVDTDYSFYTIYTSGTKNVSKLEVKLNDNNVDVKERVQLGPVIGTHVGPEAFGCVFVAKER